MAEKTRQKWAIFWPKRVYGFAPAYALYSIYKIRAFSLCALLFVARLCRRTGGWGRFLRSRGFRTLPQTECSLIRPPTECEVRAEWALACGSCHRGLGRPQGPELLAAVRGETQQATPKVIRKRPKPIAVLGRQGESPPPTHTHRARTKKAETYRGFIRGAGRVYGAWGEFAAARGLSQAPTQH